LLDHKKKKSPKRKSPSPSPGAFRHTKRDFDKRYSPSIVKKREKRNSPFLSSALESVGTIMRGNDGDYYKVERRSNGVHFWKKT
jgi:hypothetical protein